MRKTPAGGVSGSAAADQRAMALFRLLGVVSFLAIGVSILLILNLAKLSGLKRVAAEYATSC